MNYNINEAREIGQPESGRDKHEDIYDAIQNIDSVSSRLQEIIFRMTGNTTSGTIDEKCAGNISFVELMDNGGAMIRNSVNGAHGLLNEIERIVFGD